MARENFVQLQGFLLKDPDIRNLPNGEPYATCHIVVGRADRSVGDERYMKCDTPIILTQNKNLVSEIESWVQNDFVQIRGVVTERSIKKPSYCPNCAEKNTIQGALVFVTPIACQKLWAMPSREEALKRLSGSNREFSNIVHMFGTLCREPKKVKTKEGAPVTRFQIATNRKFYIREDSPEIKTDYPWVYAYGDLAKESKRRLVTGSEIYVDGCLQVRRVQRQTVCPVCGESYRWNDNVMEIVPYSIEFGRNTKTDEMLEQEQQNAWTDAKKQVLGITDDEEDDDTATE